MEINYLIDQFNNFKKSMFRLELLNSYDVEGDRERFQAYLNGEKIEKYPFDDWLNMLDQFKSRGAICNRVHVVDTPLSNYLNYEIEWGYRLSEKHGEKIYLIDRKDYKNLISNLNLTPKEHWLFDDSVIIYMEYDNNGNFIKDDIEVDENVFQEYVNLKNKLLSSAEELETFLKNRKIKLSRS